MTYKTCLFLIVCISLLYCNNSKTNNDMTKIEGTIGEYIVNASHDNFENGSFAIYDAVTIVIAKPYEQKDKELTILLAKEEGNYSIWKQKGKIVSFEINPIFLEKRSTIFEGALDDIQIK
jgi:hypothetical protein